MQAAPSGQQGVDRLLLRLDDESIEEYPLFYTEHIVVRGGHRLGHALCPSVFSSSVLHRRLHPSAPPVLQAVVCGTKEMPRRQGG